MLIKNLLYILQSDNYEIDRFLKYVYTHFKWWQLQQRQKLTWTKKSISIYIVSISIYLLILLALFFSIKFWSILFLIILLPFLPLIIVVSLLLLTPLDYYFKKQIVDRAKGVINGSKAVAIGITGSYGKTSTKEILAKILEEKYSVVKTPGNINTDIGISEFIIKSKDAIRDAQILIVEMGAYKRGEIKKICNIVKPAYSILTGINESHLEKFGSLKNTIAAKFELPENTKNLSVINLEDKNIADNYQQFKIRNLITADNTRISNVVFKDNFAGINFTIDRDEFSTKLLGAHNATLILMCIEIAKLLNVDSVKIKEGVDKIKPFEHRLEPIYNSNTNVWVLDDSYNGNFNGITSGLEVLNRAVGRKVVLTPGLVEQGNAVEAIHKKIGELYSKNVDLVLLVKNNVTQYIATSLKENNFLNFKIYDSTQEAHADLANVLKPGDTIIFQNDWPDNYF